MMGVQTLQAKSIGYLNHSYAYADQNPVNVIDPTGESTIGYGFGSLHKAWTKELGRDPNESVQDMIEVTTDVCDKANCVIVCAVVGKVEGDTLKKITSGQARKAAAAGLKVVGKRMVSVISGVGGAVLTAQCSRKCF